MVRARSKKDFIGFILAAEQDKKLIRRFLSTEQVPGLYDFFQKEGFTEILEPDCRDILTARSRLEKVSIGDMIDESCPTNAKY